MSAPVDVMEWLRQCAPDDVLTALSKLLDAAEQVNARFPSDSHALSAGGTSAVMALRAQRHALKLCKGAE